MKKEKWIESEKEQKEGKMVCFHLLIDNNSNSYMRTHTNKFI